MDVKDPSPALASTLVADPDQAAAVDRGSLDEHLPPEFASFPAALAAWRVSSTRAGEPRFTVLGRLGAGSQGVVFSVGDRDFRRDVALKTLRPENGSADGLSRFVHEAQITAQLEHPGIVPVHDFGALPDGSVFYTMKRIAGDSLADILARGTVSRFDLLQWFTRVCQTVAFAHHHGVIHRDLKPGNIMIGTYGEVLVLDWGLAKVLGRTEVSAARSLDTERSPRGSSRHASDSESASQGSSKTMVGYAVGTPAYMSPEQARGEIDRVDRRSDVYALGVILYEMLSGRSPYIRGDVQRTLEQAASGRWTRIDRQPGCLRLPRRLVAIVHRAMALEPTERYPDPGSLAADVSGFIAGASVSAYRESVLETSARWLSNHRKPVLSAAIALLVSLAAAGTLWAYNSHHQRQLITSVRDDARRAELANDLDRARRSYERLVDLVPADRTAQVGLERVVRGIEHRALERTRAQAAQLGERAAVAQQEGRLGDAIAALQGALAVLPSAEASDALAHLIARQEESAAQELRAQRLREAGDLLRWVETDAAEGRARDAQAHLDQARGLAAEHPDLARCERLVVEALAHERAAAADGLIARAAASGASALDLHERIRIGKAAVQTMRVELHEASTASTRARLHRAERALEELEESREGTLASQIALLHQAQALAPDHVAVRRALADWFIDRLLEAEAAGHRAESAAAEAQARAFDDGSNAALLAGDSTIRNRGEAQIRIRPLAEQDDRIDQVAGDGCVVPPGGSATVPHGRYLIANLEGAICAVRLERGRGRDLSLPKPPQLPVGVAYIPAGTVYLADGRPHEYVRAYAIALHEVTCGEYLRFLNDPETLRQYDAALDDGRLRFAPRASFDAADPLWRRKGVLRSKGGEFLLETAGRSNRLAIAVDAPVWGIDYEDAEAYASWLARRDGHPWRLPSRSEWQLAAQGGDGRQFPWGMSADLGHCHSSSTVAAHPDPTVGSFPVDRTVHGVMDLAGSLSEFVSDASPSDPRRRLLMGGNFHDARADRYGCWSQREVDVRWVHRGCGMRLALSLD
ncbi:MAG: SUMF1/EgtB/PvdO family nonheme iron enzyme [Planctomycetes bacterium]|nr:SUMF1/EgtB/PvdO family nonheme iron enzyme [Planctomycetota bacterium]